MLPRIVEREREIAESTDATLKQASHTVQLVIDQGLDLIEAKGPLDHGEWEDWFIEHVADQAKLSLRRAQAYMQLAKAAKALGSTFFRDAKSIQGAFRLLGLVPDLSGPKHLSNGATMPPIYNHLNWLAEWWTKERDSVAKMPQAQLATLEERLRPVAEVYATVKERLESGANA